MRRWQALRELNRNRPFAMPPPAEPPPPDESPGVPGFRSWRGVYLFVFTVFLLTVGLLALFARVFA
jgi:hypothetical protein